LTYTTRSPILRIKLTSTCGCPCLSSADTSAQPYVDGTLPAIRKVSTLNGLHRGLDSVMDF
jgi:hypothetical protein